MTAYKEKPTPPSDFTLEFYQILKKELLPNSSQTIEEDWGKIPQFILWGPNQTKTLKEINLF